jgi:hypothetical protein
VLTVGYPSASLFEVRRRRSISRTTDSAASRIQRTLNLFPRGCRNTEGSCLFHALVRKRFPSKERAAGFPFFLIHTGETVVAIFLEKGLRRGLTNHYGSRSERGVRTTAILYSFMVTCDILRINPASYLKEALKCALLGKQVPLPHEMRTGEYAIHEEELPHMFLLVPKEKVCVPM